MQVRIGLRTRVCDILTMVSLAPIALFVYNRPEHAARAVASLAANSEAKDSELFVFSDGARSSEAANVVHDLRMSLRWIEGFARVTIVERGRNFGLAESIIDGVSSLCRSHGKVIVVEDDLVLSTHFLRYMNEGLALYENAHKVASIHGYTYPVDRALPDTFFMRGADCWGWATWARAWEAFEPDAALLLDQLRQSGQMADFDFDGTAGYVAMLDDFISGRNNSWAVRWHAAAYLRGMCTLYPGRSLVRNLGHDGSGTHCGTEDLFDSGLADSPIFVAPIEVTESPAGRLAFSRYFRSRQPRKMSRVLDRARRLFGRMAV